MKVKKKIIIMLSAILTIVITYIAWGNTALTTYKITVASEALPEKFSGFKIVQVSDLHNAEFGNDNQKLIDEISSTKADIIVITGDFIDSRRTEIDISLEFAKKAIEIAPVYYVTGNHEARIGQYNVLEEGLVECGVRVLHNEGVELEVEGQKIQLIGVDDPTFAYTEELNSTDATIINNSINEAKGGFEGYTVLLSHRPELFDIYASNKVDLTFSGHAHGGQFRIPFLGGLVAPNQGLLPKYDAGLYTSGSTNMVVSRGLGNSIFPFRINNPPEIVVVTLINK